MNWNKASAISNMVIAASVIISLVYVANQVKQNTSAIHLTAMTNTNAVWIHYQMVLAQDKELNQIFWKGLKGDGSLSHVDQNRFEAFLAGWTQSYQQSFMLYQAGSMDQDLWNLQMKSLGWLFTNKGAVLYWAKWKSEYLPAFVEQIEAIREAGSEQT